MSTELVHVPFHGGEILAVKSEQGEFAVIKPLCESIGIDANGQVQRLKRQGWAQGACMMHVPTAGGAQDLDVAAWLGYEHPRRIRSLIKGHAIDLGEVRTAAVQTTEKGGRPSAAYLLTEEQALFIAEGRRRADVWYAGHGDAHDEDPARTPRTWESYTTNLTARPQARLGPEGKSHAVAGQEARGLAQGPAQGRLTDGQRDPSALLPFALQVGTCRPLKNFSTRNSFFSCIKIVARYPAYQAGRTSPQPAGVTGRTHTVLHFLQSHLHSGRGAAPTGELRHEH